MSLVKVSHIRKSYMDSQQELQILKDVSLEIKEGEFISISGQSGCGKSTLMHIMGLLDTADAGEIYINDQIVTPESTSASHIRNQQIGFVFQFHYLIEDLTALDNVALPALVAGMSRKQSLAKARDMLRILDMSAREGHYPYQLSGGEQQRVALARALINEPLLILADEPTGNLDPQHSTEVINLMHHLNHKLGNAFVLVTHDMSIAAASPSHYILQDGRLHIASSFGT